VDWRQTISELLLDNYAGAFHDLANERGMRLTIEAYSTCPTDEMAYAGPPMSRWASSGLGQVRRCVQRARDASAATLREAGDRRGGVHRRDGEAWLGHQEVKDLGDWALCEGINRFVFHRYALQPWRDVRPACPWVPGASTTSGRRPGGSSRAWHRYLARCQYLLQQGLFVADTCMLGPRVPQSLSGQSALASLERPSHNFDACHPMR